MPTFPRDNGFLPWFKKYYSNLLFPYKGGTKPYKELPSNLQALIFTQALHDYHEEPKP